MAKKKSKIPAYVLKQFEKAMYKIGDKVIIKWLGQIKTGYVKSSKENNWGRSYMVEVEEKGLKKNQEHSYPEPAQVPLGEKPKVCRINLTKGIQQISPIPSV